MSVFFFWSELRGVVLEIEKEHQTFYAKQKTKTREIRMTRRKTKTKTIDQTLKKYKLLILSSRMAIFSESKLVYFGY